MSIRPMMPESSSSPPVFFPGCTGQHSKDPFTLSMFQKDYQLSPPRTITEDGVIWSIEPMIDHTPDRHVLDIYIRMNNAPNDGGAIYTRFSLQQPGNVRHYFEHCFDSQRNTFQFKRALTVPTIKKADGTTAPFYSHRLFLRTKDHDEPIYMCESMSKRLDWLPRVPYTFDHKLEFPYAVNMNNGVLENYLHNTVEKGMNTFVYLFYIDYQKYVPKAPAIDSICWPKPTLTGNYLGGKSISLDEFHFSKMWPNFRMFMKNFDLLKPADVDDMLDAMGYYYHMWVFGNTRAAQLTVTAERFGFYDFPQNLLSSGHVECYKSSQRAVLIIHDQHPLSTRYTLVHKTCPAVTKNFYAPMIYNEEDSEVGPIRRRFIVNGFMWAVSMEKKRYNFVEYLSVSCLVNGPYDLGEHLCWKIEISPNVKNPKYLKKRSHYRVLDTVQRTICFPTCYLFEDVVKEMGAGGPFQFKVTVSMISIKDYEIEKVAGGNPVNGVIDYTIMCSDGVKVPVNRDFVLETCELFPKDHGAQLEIDEKSTDVMHFLDHLYHGSKLYTDDTWSGVLGVAWEISCQSVLDALERAAIRSGKNADYYEGYNELQIAKVKFYRDYYTVFGIAPIDEFLKKFPEPPVELFDNEIKESANNYI